MTQIFLSYARDDNLVPPNLAKQKGGFVTTLQDQLLYEFKNLGRDRPEIWRDVHGIERGDQFDKVISDQINRSDILLVVLSLNWVARPWCLKELEYFQQRWGDDARHRIVVASKRPVPLDERPPLLQGQEGYNFFFLEPGAKLGQEQEYFDRGDVRDDRYYKELTALARYLSSFEIRRKRGPEPAAIVQPKAVAQPKNEPTRAPSGPTRTVYVAQPAADMRTAYDRIVIELQERGYVIAPAANTAIPNDSTATASVDAALAEADLSVHLLGEKLGYAPEDADPIVKLQLARAALRNEAKPNSADNAPPFRRVIWAPRVLTDNNSQAQPQQDRDPMAVLAKFDSHLGTDKVVGENLSKFVDFLVQHLDSLVTPIVLPVVEGDLEADTSVYVYHRPEDQDYALQIAKLLQDANMEPRLPALEGDPAELSALHRQELQNCKSVVLCWANASEVWVKATSRELSKWRELGRAEKFSCRAVVAGPPPGQRKNVLAGLPPRNEIDLVLDLTGVETIQRATLDPLIRASRSGGA